MSQTSEKLRTNAEYSVDVLVRVVNELVVVELVDGSLPHEVSKSQQDSHALLSLVRVDVKRRRKRLAISVHQQRPQDTVDVQVSVSRDRLIRLEEEQAGAAPAPVYLQVSHAYCEWADSRGVCSQGVCSQGVKAGV